jgi:hypothetical protein
MEFGVLGLLEVWANRAVMPMGTREQQFVLAVPMATPTCSGSAPQRTATSDLDQLALPAEADGSGDADRVEGVRTLALLGSPYRRDPDPDMSPAGVET